MRFYYNFIDKAVPFTIFDVRNTLVHIGLRVTSDESFQAVKQTTEPTLVLQNRAST